MAHPSLVENLFNRRRSRNISLYSISKDSDEGQSIDDFKVKIRFNIKANTNFGQELRVTGNTKELGNWKIQDSLLLSTSAEKYPTWSSPPITIQLLSLPYKFEYKYLITSPKKSEAKWETFSTNREILCSEKSPKNYIFEVDEVFDVYSISTLKVCTKSDFTQALSKIPFMESLAEQLHELTELLSKEHITCNTLALSCIAVKNMKNEIGSDYSSYSSFVDWCSKNITVQQTKILLSAISPTSMWLAVPESDLTEKISAYQEVCYSNDDVLHLEAIADLRMAMLEEYNTSDDTAGLLITEMYLEKSEIALLERLIESIEENETQKMIMVGVWITQCLYLHCIKPKQSYAMIIQFEKLKRQESLEIFRDLLNELLTMILDVYSDLYQKVEHQECEALAALLQSEYKILYYGIFQICSQYLLRTLPILNKFLAQIPFMCYQSGNCCGELCIFNNTLPKSNELIVFVQEVNDEFELPTGTKAFVVIYVDHLYHPCLLKARMNGIPVAIGYFPPLVEGKYLINVNEDSYTIQRAE